MVVRPLIPPCGTILMLTFPLPEEWRKDLHKTDREKLDKETLTQTCLPQGMCSRGVPIPTCHLLDVQIAETQTVYLHLVELSQKEVPRTHREVEVPRCFLVEELALSLLRF